MHNKPTSFFFFFFFFFGCCCCRCCCWYYHDDDVSSEEKVLRRMLVDSTAAASPSPALASATLSNPVALLLVGTSLYASEFRRDRVLVSSTTSKQEWRVFVDRGPHCTKKTGVVNCAILDGAWGLARFEGLIFVSSFGSDQILGFDEKGRFVKVFGGPPLLDSPEGIVVAGTDGALLAASFLDSRLVSVDLNSGKVSTLAAGVPIEVDIEAGAFRPRSEEDVRRAARDEAELWKSDDFRREATDFSFRSLLSGPEHVAFITDKEKNRSSLFVSSLHNDSLIEFDPNTMTPRNVYRDLDGPLGLAVVYDASALRNAIGFEDNHHRKSDAATAGYDPLLLVASYRQDRILAIDPSADDDHRGGESAVRAVPLVQDARLQGPSALVFDPPSSLYVACYDSGAVLYFDLLPSSPLVVSTEERNNQSSSSSRRRINAEG